MAARRGNEAGRSTSFPGVDRKAIEGVVSAMVEAHPWVDAVYLFGSRARGCARGGSDIDLAVLASGLGAPDDCLMAEAELARFVQDGLGAPVDAG